MPIERHNIPFGEVRSMLKESGLDDFGPRIRNLGSVLEGYLGIPGSTNGVEAYFRTDEKVQALIRDSLPSFWDITTLEFPWITQDEIPVFYISKELKEGFNRLDSESRSSLFLSAAELAASKAKLYTGDSVPLGLRTAFYEITALILRYFDEGRKVVPARWNSPRAGEVGAPRRNDLSKFQLHKMEMEN